MYRYKRPRAAFFGLPPGTPSRADHPGVADHRCIVPILGGVSFCRRHRSSYLRRPCSEDDDGVREWRRGSRCTRAARPRGPRSGRADRTMEASRSEKSRQPNHNTSEKTEPTRWQKWYGMRMHRRVETRRMGEARAVQNRVGGLACRCGIRRDSPH